MYRQNAVLVELLEPVITALNYVFWGVEQTSDARGVLIRIYIDHEAGISLEDCEQVSRQIVGVLDVEDPIQGAYNLEVSSPGLDRPLFTLEQFQQFVGEQALVRLRTKIQGRKKISGVIKAVDENEVIINDLSDTHRIDADEIEQAHILPQL